ncbi:MAG TPA: precorrin-6y C5,15-methyltransferase (decarboxylating) subunit CbiE [Stellaceae bacterium]|jgi:precorrin-6Y C5,15-methyltransferase (decarboxylating)|nr:precorrin-6y C5,15-methyltransferase (decarboxylating) subunit CbiE [Stellaceae bacterium]
MKPWLAVIGISEDGLAGVSGAARALVETAEFLVGGARHLAMVPPGAAERLEWRRPITDTVPLIAARRGRRVAVLASGDPMWYGVGAMLASAFPREEMTILPQPGAFSLAAARLGWPLADCALVSLHGRPLGRLRLHLTPGRRVLILSDDGATPRNVARLLTELGWGPSQMTVFEHLGGSREATVDAIADEWGERAVADLNTIAVECRPGPTARTLSRLAGLPDDAFEHDGQLTKREVRAASLAALAPLDGETLWDIGAGSGSIAIEWLRAIESGSAVSVERDAERAAAIARNAAKLGVPRLELIVGEAPATLPQSVPDAIFVGGGVADPLMLPALWQVLRPGGRLVANAVSLAGERALLDWQARHGGALTRIAVSRAEPLGGYHAWRPLLPVTQLAAVKPG